MSEAIGIVAPSAMLFGAYLWLAARCRWPWVRTASFAAGLAVVGAGIGFDDISLAVHMAGHGVIVAIGAPLLVLGRPVTLLLRALPRPAARDLAAGLRAPWVRRLLWPPLAFAAFVGAQLAFHLTPLFWDALREEGLHAAEHLLFLLTALWLWSVCLAVEPLPGRWSPWARAGLLMVAMSASDAGAVKLMLDGYQGAGVAMLASMLPLGVGAAAVAWTAVLREERRQRRREVAHAAG
ncbi:MAG TPA: cytochrome c oxidase assembly protein [Solirubrobacterales bacterium]|jgi:putative membrane protein|nr:cytochrome c oxidase assembly protein [Solirubrobacterales bacterium]